MISLCARYRIPSQRSARWRGRGCVWACCWGVLVVGGPHIVSAQPPAEFFEAMKAFSQQAENFVPGFVREIAPEERARLAQIEIPLKEEQQYGAQVLQNYEAKLKQENKTIIRRGREVTYLKALVETIRPHMRRAASYRSIRVGIIPSDQPDAYSIPGGELLFTSGLIDSAGSEAALIGVVAHELSHLDRGHQLLPLKLARLNSPGADWQRMLNSMAAFKPFHPEFEREADEDAWKWMVATGYDPRELAHLLESWDQRQNSQAPWVDLVPGFVRSHPDAGRRAQWLLEQYATLPAGTNLYIGQENLRRRIARQQRQF